MTEILVGHEKFNDNGTVNPNIKTFDLRIIISKTLEELTNFFDKNNFYIWNKEQK